MLPLSAATSAPRSGVVEGAAQMKEAAVTRLTIKVEELVRRNGRRQHMPSLS